MNKMELYTYYNLDECIDRAIAKKDWNLIKMKVKVEYPLMVILKLTDIDFRR
jgi:hypothetical protein